MLKSKNYSKKIKFRKIENIIELNDEVIRGKSSEIIKLAEKDHENRLNELVKEIINSNELKIVLISGPSSSGKTTFAQKLERKLDENRKKSIIISMDNYFKDACDTPIGVDGKPDYESLHSLEIELFQNQISNLIKKICILHYDFEKGKKIYDNNYLNLENNEIEEHFKCPVFVTNYPKEIKSFYMKLDEDGRTVAATDCLCPGIGEMIGGSQREERLDVLLERMKECGLREEDYAEYLDSRRYGSVVHSGFGLGFERLVMYITGVSNIRDTIPYPRTVGNI